MIHVGDCRDVMNAIESDSIDALVTDPPYGLSDYKPAEVASMITAWVAGSPYQKPGRGFMGREWDSCVPGPDVWREAFRVMKPGAHGVVFAGSRTVDLMGLSLRLAGFEIRDSLQWLYGSGFPKSLDVSKAIGQSSAGVDDGYLALQWDGWGTALKPAHEPIILIRKPLTGTVAANVLEHGTGGINIGATRVSTDETIKATRNVALGSSSGGIYGAANTPGVYEQSEGGRWPANVILDEEAGAILDDQAGPVSRYFYCAKTSRAEREAGLGAFAATRRSDGRTKDIENPRLRTTERRNDHPTVKPIALMRWLCRMVTPQGGIIIDPFIGSGTTAIAANAEGFRWVGAEIDSHYAEIAEARIAHWRGLNIAD